MEFFENGRAFYSALNRDRLSEIYFRTHILHSGDAYSEW
jgi:hypothetical protein